MLSREISKLLQPISFLQIFICIEESNCMKDYIKVGLTSRERKNSSPFLAMRALNVKNLPEKNLGKRAVYLVY